MDCSDTDIGPKPGPVQTKEFFVLFNRLVLVHIQIRFARDHDGRRAPMKGNEVFSKILCKVYRYESYSKQKRSVTMKAEFFAG
ncbi:MAG: hypothetical protein C4293_15180 [Nitrospiraceae bacterium]